MNKMIGQLLANITNHRVVTRHLIAIFLVFPVQELYAQVFIANNTDSNVISKRILNVENGLLLPVAVKGKTPEQFNLINRMQKYHTSGISIAVINNGRIEWAKEYGYIDSIDGKLVNTQTLFQAGSISKAMSATAALSFVQKGVLKLDEDINKNLLSWKIPQNDFTKEKKVTLRQVLCHSAGITIHGFPGYEYDDTIPTLLQILNGQKPCNTAPVIVDIIPGSKYRYSGGGFTVLQQLLIDVGKKSFPQSMNESLISKTGMKNTLFAVMLPVRYQSNVAVGHEHNGMRVKGNWNYYPELAAAGGWSTPYDLALLAIEIQKGFAGKRNKLLLPKTIHEMLSPQINQSQGLGWELAGNSNSLRFFHAGDTKGYKCKMIAYANNGKGAVVMANSDHAIALIDEILRSIAKQYDWLEFLPKEKEIISVNASFITQYLGTYALEIASEIRIVVTLEDSLVQIEIIQPSGKQKEILYPESQTKFFSLTSDFSIEFCRGKDGKIDHLIIHQNQDHDYKANKLK